MARTVVTLQTLFGPRGTDGKTLTWTAADVANQNAAVHTGRLIVLARNTGASARTVTVTSAAEAGLGRVGHITADSLAAAEVHAYGPFGTTGWQQADGRLYFEANHAEVEFAVLEIPPV